MKTLLLVTITLATFVNEASAQGEKGQKERLERPVINIPEISITDRAPSRNNQGGRERPNIERPTPVPIPTPAPPVIAPAAPNLNTLPLATSQVTLDALKKLEDLENFTAVIAGMISFNTVLNALKTKSGNVEEFAKNVNDMNVQEFGQGLSNLEKAQKVMAEKIIFETLEEVRGLNTSAQTPETRRQLQIEFDFWNKLHNMP